MHAFVEPHLSLDAPMRENYRPDLAFHASDGLSVGGGDGLDGTGSDGAMRMPPMTFVPMINMADAVRQPRPKLAQTAAWLSVITADMTHQVCPPPCPTPFFCPTSPYCPSPAAPRRAHFRPPL
eukprot:SAG22_NODE_207_length_15278_cov_4.056855_15_plen_123_part_00